MTMTNVNQTTTISPEQYWNHLAELEIYAIDRSHHDLKNWAHLAEKCMNLAIQVPFLKGEKTRTISLNLASAFLKRTMSDFRGTWLLLNWGYPYQAACTVASLYENSLVVNCISGRDDLANVIVSSKGGDIPWKPQQLCKMAAQIDLYGEIKSKNPDNSDFEKAWKLCYHNYKLLCKMKHPTLQQIKDETKHTMLDGHQFGVIPLPDTRDSIIGLKEMLMIISISKLFSAAKCFAKSIKCPEKDEYQQKLLHLADEIYTELMVNIRNSKISNIPIKVMDFKI